MITNKSNDLKWLVVLTDLILYVLSFVLAFLLRYGLAPDMNNIQAVLIMMPVFIGIFLMLSVIYNVYSEYRELNEIVISLGWIVFLALILNLAFSFLLRQFAVPRTIFAISSMLQFIILSSWRCFVWYKKLLLLKPRAALLIVEWAKEESIKQSIDSSLGRSLDVVKQITFSSADEAHQAWEQFKNGKKSVEVIVLSKGLPEELTLDILDYCIAEQVKVMLLPGIYEVFVQNARLISADDMPIFQLQGLFDPNWMADLFKRGLDLFSAALGLLIFSPVMLLVAILIRIDSRGPVFYKQTRVGRKNRLFKVIKFRTMTAEAEKECGPVLATENDPRITRVGMLLRSTRIDELPQLWNVLKGDMSLVGPRPERPFFVDMIKEDVPSFDYRHQIPGGITGLAQIEGRYSTQPENKLAYDLIYAQNSSIMRDLVIILRTLGVVFQKKKAS